MPKTAQERLDEVQAAITEITTRGQSYAIDGRRKDRGDLDALFAQERRLTLQVEREARGGVRVRYGAPQG